MGVNEKELPAGTPVSFVLLDNHHLTEHGVSYFCAKSKQTVVITSNTSHPAFRVDAANLHIICQEHPSLSEALELLKHESQKSSNAYSNHSTTADFFLKNAGTR